MFNTNISISSTGDRTEEIKQALNKLRGMDVLVGIPQDDSTRADVIYNDTHKRKKKQGSISRGEDNITNAQLLFIHTNGIRKKAMRMDMESNVNAHGYHRAYEMYIQANGSPLWNSPPRPIIEPAIEADKDVISELLRESLSAGLDGNINLAKKYLNKAGLEGQATSQDWFDNPENGWPANSPLTIAKKGSDKPLIDTGELRKAITYVIRDGD